MPRPQRPRDPTTSANLDRYRFHSNVYQLLLDAASMPALGGYFPQYLEDLRAVRTATRDLRESAAHLDDAISTLVQRYQNRDILPEYFIDLLRDFASQVHQ